MGDRAAEAFVALSRRLLAHRCRRHGSELRHRVRTVELVHDGHEVAVRTRGHRTFQTVVELELVESSLRVSGFDVLDDVFAVLVGDAQMSWRHLARPGGFRYPSHNRHASPSENRADTSHTASPPNRWCHRENPGYVPEIFPDARGLETV
ncbi:hypothetical protein GCM10020001_019770 [Nonomuraea salmonea]